MSKIELISPDQHALNLAFQNAVQNATNTFPEKDRLLAQAMIEVAMAAARSNIAFDSEAVLALSKEICGYLGTDVAAQLNGIATKVSEFKNAATPRL